MRKGQHLSEELRRNLREKNLGRHHTQECNEKIGNSNREFYRNNPQKRIEISNKMKAIWDSGRHKVNHLKGQSHPNWKGSKAKYYAIHEWARKQKPLPFPPICQRCGKDTKLVVSNISGEYKRDLNDYEWVCQSCNMNYDITKFWIHGR